MQLQKLCERGLFANFAFTLKKDVVSTFEALLEKCSRHDMNIVSTATTLVDKLKNMQENYAKGRFNESLIFF